jgi:hypothetical protein
VIWKRSKRRSNRRGEIPAMLFLEFRNNPISEFRAIVSSVESDGVFKYSLTAAFPASTGPSLSGGGNAEIETTVALPQLCNAPIIFVTSPGGDWFAATGK